MFYNIKMIISSFFYTKFTVKNDKCDDKLIAFITPYKELSQELDDNQKSIIHEYCKQNEPKINKELRTKNNLSAESLNVCDALDKTTSQTINKKIIAYRIITIDPFSDKYIGTDNIFTEKGFMSTSIVDGDINSIHKGQYKLVILIAKSCSGFYVEHISNRRGEYELLLKRGVKLKEIARKRINDKINILCKIVR